MDLKPLHDQLDRLNCNLETWIGLVATLNAKPGAEPVVVESATPAAPEAPAAEPEQKRGRPRKRYFYNSAKHWVQENSTSPGPEWVEVTKTKFEEIRDKIAKGELKPGGDEPEKAAAPAPNDDDPFADEPTAGGTTALTLENVREAAFKVRDKFGMDEARKIIAKYGAKLDQVKPSDFASLIGDCEQRLAEGDL